MKSRKHAAWLFVIIVTALIANVARTGVVKAYDFTQTKVAIDYNGESQITDYSLGPGSEFKVNITVNYIEKLWSYQVKLGEKEPDIWIVDPAEYQGWNASVLNLTKVENGPFLGSEGGNVEFYTGDINETQGTLSLTIGLLDPPKRYPTGGGTLATLTFKVLSRGASPIQFSLDTGLLNRTGGFMFDGVWLRGTPPELAPGLPVEHPDFLVDGYFDNRPSVRVDPPLVKGIPPGENFTVNIDVLNISQLHSWTFSMKWNATVLNATTVTEGDFLNSSGATDFDPGEMNSTAGEINNVTASFISPTEEVAGTGTLASLTFDVMDAGASGLNFSNVELYDSAGEKISVGMINGSFTNLWFHEIEVSSVTPTPSRVKEGSNDTILIDVNVTNTGSFNETNINVTAYYDGVKIGNQTIEFLANKTFSEEFASYNYTTALTFLWNTTDVKRAKYKLNVDAVNENVTASASVNVVIWAHDIAITKVETPVGTVYSGDSVNVKVEAKNLGTEPENFNVTAYYDGNEIDTLLVTNLEYKESEELVFDWDTTGVALGNYTIKAVATGPFVQNETEADKINNELVRTGHVAVVAAGTETLSLGLILLIVVPIVAIAAITIVYFKFIKRRRPPEVIG